MQETTNPMTQAPVNTMLWRMAAPISLGMLSTFLFQIVDTYFVGKLGSAELAALAFSSPAFLLFLSVFMGLSVGVSAVVAKTIGAGDRTLASGLTMVSLALALFLSVAFGYGAYIIMVPMFTALGAAPDILPMVETYMGILYFSFPFLMLGIIGSGAARAIGITKETEIIFGIAGVINLIFDYLLIFGIGPFPELGLAGAAWATAMSFVFIFVGVMIILARHGLIRFGPMPGALSGLREILRFSVPTVSMQILIPATGMFTTYLLAGYGSEAVAAFGVASRIEALALTGIFAVSMAVTPFVAQNFGAGEHDRIDTAVIFAGKASVYLGVLLFVILALLGPSVARIFSDDPDVVRFVGLYFRIVAVSYGFQGIVNVTVAVFNGLQMPGTALKLMGIRTFFIVFPFLFVGSLLGQWWILIALTVGNVLAAVLAARLMRGSQKKWNRPIADASPWADIRKDVVGLFQRK
ncbi:MATE family efflux transporter [Candidatus Halocynthiibacter alkanivorans]|uniref:MATE family efflux transporter n=1 Tax=Candidatus Halocynthiibacter alkanivorans TaxID=2267619 RepID=UPI000DF461BC|nr:MATE family efflux transporter [Candidatus Halocynthiibacter alkanivorans]